MALKLDYVVRETSTNMRRNVTLTIAAIVTMAVSLGLFGSAMLIRAGVDSLSSRWQKGVEVIVFVDRKITPEQTDALEKKLEDHPEVADFSFMDTAASTREYKRIFEDNQAMLDRIEENPELLPNSYRITPVNKETQSILSLTRQLKEEPGVLRATSALEGVRRVQHISSAAQTGILVVAVGLLLAAMLLILNAIRMAMFARRREIEVMKLVGATNWFIRVPFMMEGMIQGIVGSALAVGGIVFLNRYMQNISKDQTTILSGFAASGSEVMVVMISVVVLGIMIGAVGSGWALSRFLKV
jgi:cell division transport system permease protein